LKGGTLENIDIVYNNLNKNKEIVKKLLEDVLKVSILDLEFKGREYFNSITDYDFSLIKLRIIYADQKEDEIYLKMIRGGKIKESIFCYWSILYEEFLKNNQSYEQNIVQKAIITQVMSDKNVSSLLLTLDARLNYCAEINLVELKQYVKNYKDYGRWVSSLDIKDEDILFIGKKLY
jgi:hypothetical protein